MKQPSRSEEEVFADLAALCRQPGYVHAIANLCFRDNVIIHVGDLTEDDMRKTFSSARLIRSEITTLLGLMVKDEVDWALPSPGIVQEHMDATEQLLNELHQCLSAGLWSGLTKEAVESGVDPFDRGEALREPIFYGGESAYVFQYLDLAVRKYAADAEWIALRKGFTVEQASHVARAIMEVQAERFESVRERMRAQHPDQWTMLPIFSFSLQELVARVRLTSDVVRLVLGAFEFPDFERNEGFNALHDFNVIAATPLLRMPNDEWLSLQSYALAEAIYEAPFFWMVSDKSYLPTLDKNRGDFVETFVAERLGLVFGVKNVHRNVDVFETKAKKVSDIDVLVVWGNRIVIAQAKSKRLTLESKKGNDLILRDDFRKAVQAAYAQGAACAKGLLENGYRLCTTDGRDLVLPKDIKEVYIFCVISDHYPALSFQTRQFLKTESIDRVQAPLVMDVFTLDAMTEMLQSPLRFLSYVNRRVNYADRLLASQELTILGYHLSNNLWVQSDVGMVQLGDDFSAGLDIAMAVRRTGLNGAATPEGVLTRLESTTVGRIIREIEDRSEAATIDLGFLLLAMSERAVSEISRAIDRLSARSRADGKLHDVTFSFKEGAGITFHLCDEPVGIAGPRLESYCERRKYRERATEWFGLCLSPAGRDVRFGVTLIFPWCQDEIMDERTKDMHEAMPIDQLRRSLASGPGGAKKIGRNDPCPCGSGRKYKKCCLN